jgi:hypothetical protein
VGYSIDTSSLIWAWRFAYPLSRFPSVWARVEQLIRLDDLRASQMVLAELERIEDDLHEWARAHTELFIEIDDGHQQVVRAILADFRGLVRDREDRVNADPFVIALAIRSGCAVVTEERPSGNPATPKIPNVCAARNVSCVNFLGLIEQQGWTF